MVHSIFSMHSFSRSSTLRVEMFDSNSYQSVSIRHIIRTIPPAFWFSISSWMRSIAVSIEGRIFCIIAFWIIQSPSNDPESKRDFTSFHISSFSSSDASFRSSLGIESSWFSSSDSAPSESTFDAECSRAVKSDHVTSSLNHQSLYTIPSSLSSSLSSPTMTRLPVTALIIRSL